MRVTSIVNRFIKKHYLQIEQVHLVMGQKKIPVPRRIAGLRRQITSVRFINKKYNSFISLSAQFALGYTAFCSLFNYPRTHLYSIAALRRSWIEARYVA